MKYVALLFVGFVAGVVFAPQMNEFKERAQHAVNDTHVQLPRN